MATFDKNCRISRKILVVSVWKAACRSAWHFWEKEYWAKVDPSRSRSLNHAKTTSRSLSQYKVKQPTNKQYFFRRKWTFNQKTFWSFFVNKRKICSDKKIYEAGIWRTNRKENAKPVECHRSLALMSAAVLTKKFFLRMAVFDKNVNFLRNCWSDWSENFLASPQDNFGKMEIEQRGVVCDQVFKKR